MAERQSQFIFYENFSFFRQSAKTKKEFLDGKKWGKKTEKGNGIWMIERFSAEPKESPATKSLKGDDMLVMGGMESDGGLELESGD